MWKHKRNCISLNMDWELIECNASSINNKYKGAVVKIEHKTCLMFMVWQMSELFHSRPQINNFKWNENCQQKNGILKLGKVTLNEEWKREKKKRFRQVMMTVQCSHQLDHLSSKRLCYNDSYILQVIWMTQNSQLKGIVNNQNCFFFVNMQNEMSKLLLFIHYIWI